MPRKLLAVAFLALVLAPAASARPSQIMPGFAYDQRVLKGPVHAYVVTAPKPGGLYSLTPILSNGTITGRETVSSMERRVSSQMTTIGVNAYLWRASLDTLGFMPLLQTDSNGGVIVTDWYVNPNVPTERMKVTVTILDQDLRADALRVAALREISRSGHGMLSIGKMNPDSRMVGNIVPASAPIMATRCDDVREEMSIPNDSEVRMYSNPSPSRSNRLPRNGTENTSRASATTSNTLTKPMTT